MDHKWRDPVRKWNRWQREYMSMNHHSEYINQFLRRGPQTLFSAVIGLDTPNRGVTVEVAPKNELRWQLFD